jgi:putative DNA-invertase from lambdoid prophage Rac
MVEIYAYAQGWRHSEEDVKEQRSAIRAYASEHGMKVSRYAARAVGFLFRRAKAGDVIIAARFADLFHSPAVALKVVADLESRGVALHFVDLGCDMASISRLFVTMATAFAEGSTKLASERGRRSKAVLKASGRYAGGRVPFGFRRQEDGALVPHDGEQEAIREIIAMKVDKKPLRAIAATMVAKGHTISHEGVAGVLRASDRTGRPRREKKTTLPTTAKDGDCGAGPWG